MSYTKNQEARIQQVNQAAKELINLLIQCPEYLAKHLPAPLISIPVKETLPTMVADLVSDLLSQHGYTVFYPNKVEIQDPPIHYVSELYETEEQMEKHVQRLMEDQLQ